mgnify:CR=1 FL=1
MMEYENKPARFGPISLFDLHESSKGENLQAALKAAYLEFAPLAKSGVNKFFKTDGKPHLFSTLKDIEDATSESLIKNNLMIRHQVIPVTMGNDLQNILRTTIEHTPSGEFFSSMIAMDNTGGPQSNGSQVTYFRRYNLICLLNLEADDEDDGNAAQGNKGEKAAPTTKTPQRSYELYDVNGKQKSNYTSWKSFKKALEIEKYAHSEKWREKQIAMLQELRQWALIEKKSADDKAKEHLHSLSEACLRYLNEINKFEGI